MVSSIFLQLLLIGLWSVIAQATEVLPCSTKVKEYGLPTTTVTVPGTAASTPVALTTTVDPTAAPSYGGEIGSVTEIIFTSSVTAATTVTAPSFSTQIHPTSDATAVNTTDPKSSTIVDPTVTSASPSLTMTAGNGTTTTSSTTTTMSLTTSERSTVTLVSPTMTLTSTTARYPNGTISTILNTTIPFTKPTSTMTSIVTANTTTTTAGPAFTGSAGVTILPDLIGLVVGTFVILGWMQ